MTAKKRWIAAITFASVALMGGCDMLQLQTEEWVPQEADAISIDAEGKVTEIVQETLSESYYDMTELQNMITASVEEYNRENGEGSVTVGSFETEGQKVTLVMEYASAQDYASFNHTDLYYGSMINAQIAGYLFDTEFYRIQNGTVSGSAVDSSAVLKEMAAQVLVVQAPLEVHIEGTVLYTSTNAEMLSADTIKANHGDAQEEALVLPSSALYEGEEASFDEQQKADRVYIIYEAD